MNHPSPLTQTHAHYHYSSPGQRIRKCVPQPGHDPRRQQVNYLPMLEVRSTRRCNQLNQGLLVIIASSVRILRWIHNKPDGMDALQLRYSSQDRTSSTLLELDHKAKIISRELSYPYGGSAFWGCRSQVESDYKTVHYCAKERDETGLIYYGFRYYPAWLMRWLNSDPAGAIDGLNLFRMVRNNPLTLIDLDGQLPVHIDARPREEIIAQFRCTTAKDRSGKYYLGDLSSNIIRKLGMQKVSASTAPQAIDGDTLHALALAQVACLKTQQLLPYGAQNMAVHLWQSKYCVDPDFYSVREKRQTHFDQYLTNVIKHGTGRCSEFSSLTYALLTTTKEEIHQPVAQVDDASADHSYVVIGNLNATFNPNVVADSWVTFPEAHLLNDGYFNDPDPPLVNSSQNTKPALIDEQLTAHRFSCEQRLNDEQLVDFIADESENGCLFEQNSSCDTGRLYQYCGDLYRFDTYDKDKMSGYIKSHNSFYNYIGLRQHMIN